MVCCFTLLPWGVGAGLQQLGRLLQRCQAVAWLQRPTQAAASSMHDPARHWSPEACSTALRPASNLMKSPHSPEPCIYRSRAAVSTQAPHHQQQP